MNNKVVLITGALTVLVVHSLAFAQEGARIVISGRREEEGQKLAGELRKLGAEANLCGPMCASKRMYATCR